MIISLQLSSGEIGRGLSASSASNGLLSYYPEYTSFGEFISGEVLRLYIGECIHHG